RRFALPADTWRISRGPIPGLDRSLRRQLSMNLVDLTIGIFAAAVGRDGEIRASGLLFRRPLRRETLAGLPLGQAPLDKARDLQRRRARGDDYAVERLFRAGLEQQRHVD